MLPFRLAIPAVVRTPFPSKVSRLTPANGPANAGGAVINPVSLSANAPFRVALEHPLLLLSALAIGATVRASAVTAAIAKVFAVVLRFMILSFAFINCLHSRRRSFQPPVLLLPLQTVAEAHKRPWFL